jgi:hypothetical protein
MITVATQKEFCKAIGAVGDIAVREGYVKKQHCFRETVTSLFPPEVSFLYC